MYHTIFDTAIISTSLRRLSVWLYKSLGWQVVGQVPDFPKYVLAAAPHTSNWDLLIMLGAAFALRVKVFWLGKDTLFRQPFGAFFRWLGGVPVDRSKSNGMVAQAIQAFVENAQFAIAIAPEGTRSKVKRWKTGFYHIAQGAGVPIVLGFIDYGRKAAGVGPTFITTGNIEADMRAIQAFYATITPKYPAQSNPTDIEAH